MKQLHTIAEAASDRAEMHSIIGAQRNNWHHLLFHSINSINFSASFMACMANSTAPAHPPFLTFLAFKFSSVFLYATVTAFMVLVNKIQPSQLAEEQRNATRLFKQLEKSIYITLELETPTTVDVEMAMERVLALDKAYPLPLLPGMLEKFPKTVKPTIWWPEMKKKKKKEEEVQMSKEVDEEMKGILKVLKMKDEKQYLKCGELFLRINKVLSVLGLIIGGMATAGAVFIGWPELQGVPEFMAVVGGVMGVVVNSLQHGWQVGMLFELMRNCAGYYKRLEEEIEFSLEEKKREGDEEIMFKLKMALCLGRNVSEFKDFASYASSSSSCEDDGDRIEVFAGKLF
ncbi:putative petal formation-expressed [Dioscorea sansibarensis]